MASTVFTNAVTLTDAAWFQAVDNAVYQYLSGVSGTNTITATGPSGLGAYAAGLKFRFIPANSNTGATTINITGTAALGSRNIFSGGVALIGGELIAGVPVEIVDDGTRFELVAPIASSGTWTPSLGGTTTYTVQTGTYTKTGRLVFFNCILTINLIGTGSTTIISGLPFAPENVTFAAISVEASSATAIVSANAQINTNSTITITSRTAASISTAANAIFGNNTAVRVSGCYQTP